MLINNTLFSKGSLTKRATRRLGKFLFCIGLLATWALVLIGCGATAANNGAGTTASTTPPATSSTGQPGSSGSGSGSAGNSGSGSGTGSSGSGGSGSTGGSGTTGGGSSPTTAALAYVGGANNNFYGIRVDSSSNVSTVSGSPYSLPGIPNSFASAGNLLYVDAINNDFASATLVGFRADSSGTLSQVSSTPLNSEGAGAITTDSTGKFLYASANTAPNSAGSQNAIFGFSIDQSSGLLTPLSGSPWYLLGGMGPASGPRVSANGSWFCVNMELARTNEGAQCYPRHSDGSIDGANSVQPAVSTTGICGLTITADSTHMLYTDCQQSVFSTMIESAQNGTSASAGSGAGEVDLDPTGHWLAVVNATSVSIFSVGTGDSLSPAGAPIAISSRPVQATFSRSGTYLFVDSSSGTEVFSFNPSTGALTPVNGSSLASGTGAMATM